MAYDEALAARIRKTLARRRDIAEKKMFGGICFLLNGNICVGVWKDFLIVRVGPDKYEESLIEPFVKKFDITGRAMTGWVMVDPGGIETADDVNDWVQIAIKFTRKLLPK